MSGAWDHLARDYEQSRQRPDSLDTLLEWHTQRDALGNVTGQQIVDVGCGSGAKALALAAEGAAEVIVIDVADAFIDHDRDNVHLVQGDLSTLASVPAVADRTFDKILFFQSISYSANQTQTLVDARNLSADGGTILVQRSHPIRFAVERSRANGTSLGQGVLLDSPTPMTRAGIGRSRSPTPPRPSRRCSTPSLPQV